jgi:hypothetical protein
MSGWRLRYVPGTNDGVRFAAIRFPFHTRPPIHSREQAEIVRQAMPWPDKFEIVEED